MMRNTNPGSILNFREIVPFYMKHNYSHYRYDPDYDNKFVITNSFNKSGKHNVNNERIHRLQGANVSASLNRTFDDKRRNPSVSFNGSLDRRSTITTPSFDGRYNRRNSLSMISASFNNAFDCRNNKNSQGEKFRKFSSNFQEKQKKETKILDDSIQRWNQKNDTMCEDPKSSSSSGDSDVMLPPVEETDSAAPSNTTKRTLTTRHSLSQFNTYNMTHSRATYDPKKVKLVKKVVDSRIKKGATVKELAKDPYFRDVLDICDKNDFFPALKHGDTYTFDDFRALRKCKYLRLSDKNLTSLREATIASLYEK